MVLGEPQLGDHEEAEHEREQLAAVLVQQVGDRRLADLSRDLGQGKHQQGDGDRGHGVDERQEPVEATLAFQLRLGHESRLGPASQRFAVASAYRRRQGCGA